MTLRSKLGAQYLMPTGVSAAATSAVIVSWRLVTDAAGAGGSHLRPIANLVVSVPVIATALFCVTCIRSIIVLHAVICSWLLTSFHVCLFTMHIFGETFRNYGIHPAGKWILKIEAEAWQEIQWVQDKSWSFLFAESPVISIMRDDDDSGDDDGNQGSGGGSAPRAWKPRRARHRSRAASASDDSLRTPPVLGRSRHTKTRSRISRLRTDSPLDDLDATVARGAEAFSDPPAEQPAPTGPPALAPADGELERLLAELLRSVRHDTHADPAEAESVRSVIAVVAGRSRRVTRGTDGGEHVDGHEHEEEGAG